MFTRKRFKPPHTTGDGAKDVEELGKAVHDYLLSLETPGSLAIRFEDLIGFGNVISVMDYGAKGDGVTDDGPAFQRAANKGTVVYVPAGIYKIVTQVVCPYGVSFIGTSTHATLRPGTGLVTIGAGSIIYVTSTTDSPFKYYSGNTFVGLTFYYPNQLRTAGTPTVYPATFTFSTANMSETLTSNTWAQCQFVNSYIWIDAQRGHLDFEFYDIVGAPVSKGILTDGCGGTDICRGIRGSYYYWCQSTDNAAVWMQANSAGVTVGRSDAIHMDRIYFGNLNVGLGFIQGSVNTIGGAYGSITGLSLDGNTYGIYAEETHALGINIVDMMSNSVTHDLFMTGAGPKAFQVTGFKMWAGSQVSAVRCNGAGSVLKLSSGEIYAAAGSNECIMVDAAATKVEISNVLTNDFTAPGLRTTAAITTLLVSNCDFKVAPVINDPAGTTVRFKGNTNLYDKGTALTQYTAVATGTPCTLTGAQFAGADEVAVEMTAVLGAGGTLNTPTAANIVAAITGAVAGNEYKLRIINSSSAAFAWTLTANTGVTINGTASIGVNSWNDYQVVLTSLTAVALRFVGSGGAAGSGTVSTVSGTAPIASSGGANPAISLNNSGVTYAKIQDASAGFTNMAKATTGSGAYAELAAGTDSLLMRSGSGNLTFGTAVTNQIGAAQVTYAKIQNVGALSVYGRSTNSAGVGADITGTTDQVLRVDGAGTGLGFGSIDVSKSAAVTGNLAVTNGGTGRATSTTAYALLAAGTTATGVHQTLAAGATTEILVGGGASALPVWTTASGSGAPCRVNTPTLITPAIGAATGTSLALTSGTNAGLSITDGTVTGVVYSSTGPQMTVGTTSNHRLVFFANNAEVGRFAAGGDFTAVGFIKSTSATAGVGYGTGAGGAQTQLTNKATTTILNTICGEVTMNAAQLNPATIVSFTLTNSAIAAKDVMVLNHVTTGTRGAYTLNADCAAGSATVSIRNNSATTLSEAIVLRYAVLKAVTS